jgi:proteasome activator subunit 4
MALEVISRIGGDTLDRIDHLLDMPNNWGPVERNDFCRYVLLFHTTRLDLILLRYAHAIRCIWQGLDAMICIPIPTEAGDLCMEKDTELEWFLLKPLDVRDGFALTDVSDPRYMTVMKARERFGDTMHRALIRLASNRNDAEDNVDAVMYAGRGIEAYLMSYGISRSNYHHHQKSYTSSRE